MKITKLIVLAALLASSSAINMDKKPKAKKMSSEVDTIMKEAEEIKDLQDRNKGEAKDQAMDEVETVMKSIEKKANKGRDKKNVQAVIEEVKEENHKKEQVEADKAALEEDKKDAEKELKKMKFDAIQAVKQVVAKQEEEEGGIVDTITKVFATHAKVHQKIRKQRANVEDQVSTGAAAIASAMNITSKGMKAGVETTLKTEDITAEKSKAILEKAAEATPADILAQKK